MNECMYIDRLFYSCNTVFHSGVRTYAMPQESVLGVVFQVFEMEQGRSPFTAMCDAKSHNRTERESPSQAFGIS